MSAARMPSYGRLALLCALLAFSAENVVRASGLHNMPKFSEREIRSILRLSPLPPLPPDLSNAYADDANAAQLGERLFFDTRLSATGAMSCATCHDPARAWSNDERVADSESRFPKNVPSLRNTARNRWFFWDGRADSAWAQALGPLENEREMASNRLALLHVIRLDRKLHDAYAQVFGPMPDGVDDASRFPPAARPLPDQAEHPWQLAWASMSGDDRHAANVVFVNIGKAIAAFERRIEVGESAFDLFVAGLRHGDHAAQATLTRAAQRGLKLFVGRGECTLCHSGPNLSDGEFHDVGIALGDHQKVDPGRHRGVLTLLTSPFTRVGNYADVQSPLAPVRFLDAQTHQLGQFKTPSLRGVADTAPYMHDGRFATLEQVIRFYSTRDGASPLGHPTTLLQPLHLEDGEIADLVAFLESMSAVAVGAKDRR
jgi:cytochrome c peroxidase